MLTVMFVVVLRSTEQSVTFPKGEVVKSVDWESKGEPWAHGSLVE